MRERGGGEVEERDGGVRERREGGQSGVRGKRRERNAQASPGFRTFHTKFPMWALSRLA